jgi:hypothetical protein
MTTSYTKLPCIIPNGRKIFQMIIKYHNIFHSKALQNLPKLGFLDWKYAIWQPWCTLQRRLKLKSSHWKCWKRG